MADPIPFPVERTAPPPRGVSIRYGRSVDDGRMMWLVHFCNQDDQVNEIGRGATREAAERFAAAWVAPLAAPAVAATPQAAVVTVRRLADDPETRTMKVPVSVHRTEQQTIRTSVREAEPSKPQTVRVAVRNVDPEPSGAA